MVVGNQSKKRTKLSGAADRWCEPTTRARSRVRRNEKMTKSWVSSLCHVCLAVAVLLIGVTARADLANQDWSGTPAPWPPVQGLDPLPPPRTWVEERSTSATTYSTASSGPAIPTPNPAGYLPSPPFGSFTTTSSSADYGMAYYYNDAGDNVVDSIQTVDIAITGGASEMSLIARRQDGSSGTHYGVLVGGTDRLRPTTSTRRTGSFAHRLKSRPRGSETANRSPM